MLFNLDQITQLAVELLPLLLAWLYRRCTAGRRPPPDLAMSDDAGVPLAHYLTHPGCQVRFHCEACGRSADVPIPVVVTRLKALGVGGRATGVRAAGKLTRWRCKRCGERRFETRPAFPPGRAG